MEMVDRWLTCKQVAEMIGFPSVNAMRIARHRKKLTLPLEKRDGRLGQRLSVVQSYIRGELQEG